MDRVFNNQTPRIAYVFGDLTGGGHNLQAYKTILYSGAKDNCIAVSLFDDEDNSLEEKLLNEGIEVIKLHLTIKTAIILGLRKLKEVLLNNRCAIAHSNGLKADTLCYLALRNSGVKHVITLHNYLKEDVYLRKGKFYSVSAVRLQNFVLKRSKYIIACSKTLANQMLDDNPKLRITAIQNGVDLDNFPILDKQGLRHQYGYEDTDVIFISTGSMTLRKRIPETVDAFLTAEIENGKLLMLGSGPYLEQYKEMYTDCSNVYFLGRRSDIKELLNIADVFVSSSESEGLPLAVLEAVSTGTRILLSDIPQHKEILDEIPGSGLCYSLGDRNMLAELMGKAQTDHCAQESITLYNTPFDIRVMGRTYQDFYKAVVNDGTCLCRGEHW